MKKHETLSKGEELLVDVLEECLDEDLSFIPPEREIARIHRFSQRFEDAMNGLLETNREQEIRRHFSPRYGHLAACVLVFCICGALIYQVTSPVFEKGAMEEIESAAMTEEAAPETAPEEESAEPESGAGQIQTKSYCGQTVILASQQEVPETLDYVTTLVNCPVQDEEKPSLYLTIGNIGENEIQYLNHYDLEVWIEDGWYRIPCNKDEKDEWLTLETGMAVDEKIDLSDYQIDYDEEQYRLITYVGEDLISAEFTFEEVFAETMEKLGDESSGE